MANILDIRDRVVVVLGSTSGLGRALAVGMAAEGAIVVPSGRRESELAVLCREIDASGARTLCRTSDVKDSSIDRCSSG
jgi:NADP-dependent 3-hydroxy acid dehydrogenase YdfG